MGQDWVRWHGDYEAPRSSLARRLAVVRCHLWRALGEAPRDPAGGRRLISLCAGDGRDVLPVLAAHPAGTDVRGLLLELDPELSGRARRTAGSMGLRSVDVRTVDAGAADTYRDVGRAHIVLACGVFGNLSDADMRRTVAALPALMVPGGIVIWTRGRGLGAGDRSDDVRDGFAAYGFLELAFVRPEDARFRVGMSRLRKANGARLEPGARLFQFL
ncbi:class I SAM-dependent methyltransferase [Paractinoplanes rishiriensis]|uniref:class I SAM-dependent methyltransferase n=1 Tax=Paractinoplanes rishiriensis TaxID=1050105 RepID=UPI0019452203|nr:class I SAM-dependent methyltransferase [Actinoplanes rishiriensis]